MATLSETDKAYLAGLFDGEGCITAGIGHTGVHLAVVVTNCDKDSIDNLQQLFGGNVHRQTGGISPRKKCWRWNIGARNCKPFLEAVLPYLRIKKRRAELALAFITLIGEVGQHSSDVATLKKLRLMEAITSLNHVNNLEVPTQ